MTDIDLLAQTAYDTGIDPVTYATQHVIRSHIDVWLGGHEESTSVLSSRILGDLLDAGWTPPALEPGPEATP
jgi:hypothetical protein